MVRIAMHPLAAEPARSGADDPRADHPAEIRELARRLIWWSEPEVALSRPLRVVAQAMDLGTMEDWALIKSHFGIERMREAISHAEPGWFRERSWVFWHYRLELIAWGAAVPTQPVRDL